MKDGNYLIGLLKNNPVSVAAWQPPPCGFQDGCWTNFFHSVSQHFCVSADPASEKREKETENAEMGSGNSQAELRAAGWEISQTKAEREQSTAAAFSSCVSTVQEPEWEITDIYLF